MRKSDVKIGMKVVPFRKTLPGWGDLSSSCVWERALKNNQPYLYVTEYCDDEEGKYWCLSDENIEETDNSDFFMSRDFRPYVGD